MNWKQIQAEWHADPEYRAAYEAEYPFEAVARSIARLRAAHGLTQEELARLANTTQPVIARAESGRRGVNVGLLNRIAQAVGTTWEPVFASAAEEPQSAAREVRLTYSDFEWVYDRAFVPSDTTVAVPTQPQVGAVYGWFAHEKIITLVRAEPAEKSERDEAEIPAGNRQSTLALAG